MPQSVTNEREFGILIAYVIPGLILIHGLGYHFPTISNWLAANAQPTIGGFLFATLASIAAGLFISTVRWLTVDPILHATGVVSADWSLKELHHRLAAFEMMVLHSYRYYQFYSNCFVALPAWLTLKMSRDSIATAPLWLFLLVEAVLLIGARDTLKKYYLRTNEILDNRESSIISLKNC